MSFYEIVSLLTVRWLSVVLAASFSIYLSTVSACPLKTSDHTRVAGRGTHAAAGGSGAAGLPPRLALPIERAAERWTPHRAGGR